MQKKDNNNNDDEEKNSIIKYNCKFHNNSFDVKIQLYYQQAKK